MMKGVILDRDGTLIDMVRDEESGLITTAFHPSHIRFLPGVLDGLKRLEQAGYLLAIATNQPGPAKGHFSVNAVANTNDALVHALEKNGIHISMVRACMHHPDGAEGGLPELITDCPCRKPKPGLALDILAALKLSASDSWFVGDTSSDVCCGDSAGMKTALLLPNNRCELCPLREKTPKELCRGLQPTVTGKSFRDVVQAILQVT